MKKVLYILCLFILFSCAKKENEIISYEIILPQTNTPLDMNQWGVTKFGLLKLRLEPKEDAEIINHLPLGALLEIIKKDKDLKTFDNMPNYWYYIDFKGETGWIFGYYLDIYNTEEEAIKRSEEVLFGGKNN